MSRLTSDPTEQKLLPDVGSASGAAATSADALATPAPEPVVVAPRPVSPGVLPPPRQLSELPRDELEHLADEYGLDPTRYPTRQALVAALHDRRQMIASLDRDALLDVIRWGRRPVTAGAGKEQIAQEIARIRSMRFSGLSHRGLLALAKMRGIDAREDDPVPVLIRKLKKKEGFFSRINRKRRALLGSLVARAVGESGASAEYQFLPPDGADVSSGASAATGKRPPTIKEDIEESGLFGGITNRIKKTADAYLNQKLDEVEARIDRKLDEIDRRLAEWRDKEIANRLKILKITLWVSLIVGVFSLLYSYIKIYLVPH